jgi:hypothetical protein
VLLPQQQLLLLAPEFRNEFPGLSLLFWENKVHVPG